MSKNPICPECHKPMSGSGTATLTMGGSGSEEGAMFICCSCKLIITDFSDRHSSGQGVIAVTQDIGGP